MRKRLKKKKRSCPLCKPHRASFNGVVTLTASEYARVQQCMGNPGEPSQSAQQGADLLRKLYKTGGENRWKPKERDALDRAEREARNA